jgi:hypothetical protein
MYTYNNVLTIPVGKTKICSFLANHTLIIPKTTARSSKKIFNGVALA